MHPVGPSPGEIGECAEVPIIREPFCLEPAHLAGRRGGTMRGLAANDPSHRRIASEPVGIVSGTRRTAFCGFIDENGDGPGVRLRKRQLKKG